MPMQKGGVGGAGLSDLITVIRNGVQTLTLLANKIGQVFPAWGGTVAQTATAGTAGALPATPAGYIEVVNPQTGATVKIPFYNV